MKINQLNLNENIISVMDSNKKVVATDVQKEVIPLLLKGKQVICTAPTGTGKTYSFLLPILNNLDLEVNSIQAIVLAPTRELARQIYTVLKEFKSDSFDFSSSLLVGGEDITYQEKKVKSNTNIIIGTPDRVDKVITNIPDINLKNVSHLIVDESDMCVDLDFLPIIKNIILKLDEEKTSISFFSATIPNQLQHFINKNISGKFDFINIEGEQLPISHRSIKANYSERKKLLLTMINSSKINPFFSIIFCSTKEEVQEVYEYLKDNSQYPVGKFSSELSPRKRKTEIKLISQLKYQYVVASDLLSRGIDIPGASHIFNFSIPEVGLEYYVHRAGRVGRNNLNGISYIFYDDKDKYKLQKITSNKGIKFEEHKWNFKSDEVTKIKKVKSSKSNSNDKLEMDVARIINKYKTGTRKPGYKTKMKTEIDSVKRRHNKLENRNKK